MAPLESPWIRHYPVQLHHLFLQFKGEKTCYDLKTAINVISWPYVISKLD